MKITLKNVILSFIIIFNLVIIFSNFTSYEGLEITINDSESKPKGNDTSKTVDSNPISNPISSNLEHNLSNSETTSSNNLKSNSETPLGNDFNATPLGNDSNSKINYDTPM
jgi:hypothetical protein